MTMLIDWLIDEYFNTWNYTISDFIKIALIGLPIGGVIVSVILANIIGPDDEHRKAEKHNG